MPRNPLKNIASWVFKYRGTQPQAQALLDAHLVTKKDYFPQQILRKTHMWFQLSHDQSYSNSVKNEFRAPQPPEGGDPFNYYYFSLTPKHKQPSTTIATLWGGLQLQEGEEVVPAERYCVRRNAQNQAQNGAVDGDNNVHVEIEVPDVEEDPIVDEEIKADTLIKRLKVSQLTTLINEAVRPLIQDMNTRLDTNVAGLTTKLTSLENDMKNRFQNLEGMFKRFKEDKDMGPPNLSLNLNRRNR